MNHRLRLLAAALLPSAALFAQLGDLKEDGVENTIPAARHFVPAPPLSPQEELRTFQLAPGFKMELVADESMVKDPAAAAYDLDGNLWVCQDSRYNAAMLTSIPGLADGAKSLPSGAIVKLESSHHDGHYDRRTIWLDGLNEPRGIMIVHDGVLIADPPNLWLARDTHGTGKCDEKTLIDGNYGVPYSEEESGSLLWGRDNVVRNIASSYDFRFRKGAVTERLPVQVRGQFGITQDDYGRMFYSLNSDLLRGDCYGPGYGSRNTGVTSVPWVDITVSPDQEVWPSHPTPAVNRGYRPGVLGKSTGGLRSDATLLEVTAACSATDYRGANFPRKYYGNVFVPDPSANLITRNLVLEGEGRLTAIHAYQGWEFLSSTDTRFRPVALVNAPDGSLLVVDMYRGILEGFEFITTYLHHQILPRELDKPVSGMGRLWKLTYVGGPLPAYDPAPFHEGGAALAKLLDDPNGWTRDTAQQVLVENGDTAAVPALKDMAAHASKSLTRLYALWTLEGLDAATLDVLQPALKDHSPKVRAAAVRIHERWFGGDTADQAVAQLASVVDDPAPEVLVQLALTVGDAKTPAALDLAARLFLAHGDHPYMAKAIATGLAGREMAFIDVIGRDLGTRPRPEVKPALAALTASIAHGNDAASIGRLITAIGDGKTLPKWARSEMLDSLGSLVGPSAPRHFVPAGALTSAMFASLGASHDADIKAGADRIVAELGQEEAEAQRRIAAQRPLNADEKKLYEEGKTVFQICSACHQPTGMGLPHVAPSLVDSRWVSDNPEVLVRIVLDGKEGTPGFASSMPPVGGTFTDEQVAAVLTYIRNSWGLHNGGVSPETVAKVRKQVAGRNAAWNDAQLKRVSSQLARGRRLAP